MEAANTVFKANSNGAAVEWFCYPLCDRLGFNYFVQSHQKNQKYHLHSFSPGHLVKKG